MGPLDYPYSDFHSPTLPSIFYLLLSSINLPHYHLLHFTLLLFLLCTYSFLSLSFSKMDSYCIWRIDFSFTVSNFLPFTSNTSCYISCCPINRATLPYIFLLNIFLSSSASCYLTSSSLSLLYSFSNSSTNFIVFFKFSLLF